MSNVKRSFEHRDARLTSWHTDQDDINLVADFEATTAKMQEHESISFGKRFNFINQRQFYSIWFAFLSIHYAFR